MAYEVVIPRLGLTMEEGSIVDWYKKDGEAIQVGEPMFSVETDKAVMDVEAPYGGLLYRLPNLPQGMQPIGALVGYILQPGEALPSNLGGASEPAVVEDIRPVSLSQSSPVISSSTAPTSEGRKLSSPAARRRADELGVDWRLVERPVGRPVLAAHVEAFARLRPGAEAVRFGVGQQISPDVKITPLARRMAEANGLDLTQVLEEKAGKKITRADVEKLTTTQPQPPAAGPASVLETGTAQIVGERLPITQLRRIIAQRMAESAHTTAPVTLTTEADATELVALREQFRAAREPRGLSIPTYTDLLVKLVSVALHDHPYVNAVLEAEHILALADIHIGVAVDTEAGLMVPVVRNVPALSLHQISEQLRSLSDKARARQLLPDELQGGTFTITNLGTYGIDAFTPIINLPQCAILGVGRIFARPAVVGDEILPRKLMALSLTFDHRVIDGGPAARFLNTIREYVEQPHLWLGQ
jgi:pyruvate dehydrogenase E2 component (dihydrolipoamide acetyltransferase)